MTFLKKLNVLRLTSFFLVLLGLGNWVDAQEITLLNVNGVDNPQHGDNVGDIARADTIFVKGNYSPENIQSVSLKLLTFQKDPWTRLSSHELVMDQTSELNGTLDTFLVVPETYMLGGDPDNSQFFQVRAVFSDNSIFSNLYLTVTGKPSAHNTLVDFDENYGVASGETLATNIATALSLMQEGDTLLFRSAEYDFQGSSFEVPVGVYLSGIQPEINASDEIGAYNVSTVFKNLKGLRVQSDNVRVANVELSADASTGYVFTNVSHATDGTKHYKGLLFRNVIFRYGRVQCFGRNGAGVEFTNVSFVDFTQGGYYLNRNERIDSAPQFKMQKCFFKPETDAINFNVRAISLDAGNTEYPVVWNQNNSVIDNCILDGTGLGISSKCSYVNVTNCHFLGYRMDVDMIHIEEFGHHFLIDGNTFEHISPARGIYIDREIQQCHDITITNNKWIGEYGWIISAHSPYNLVMENNDFSEAWAKNTNDLTIDLTYDHGEETQFTEYDLPATNIVFKNNTGLDNGNHGIFAYKALADDTSFDIEYPSGKIQVHIIDEAPRSVFNTSDYYRIRNKLTSDYLHAVPGQAKLELSSETKSDSSDVWQFSFEYPYFYHLKNRGTKKHMEVYRGYTMGDYNNDTQEQILVEQTGFFVGKTEKPRWYLRKYNSNGSVFYEIMPGGNERKSRNVQVGQYMELEYAKENNRGALPPEADSSWELIPLKSDVSVNDNLSEKNFNIYPNPASSVLNIDFQDRLKKKQTLSLLNSKGVLVLSKQIGSGTRSVTLKADALPNGLYLLKVNSGQSEFYTKVIIKR